MPELSWIISDRHYQETEIHDSDDHEMPSFPQNAQRPYNDFSRVVLARLPLKAGRFSSINVYLNNLFLSCAFRKSVDGKSECMSTTLIVFIVMIMPSELLQDTHIIFQPSFKG